MDGILFLIVSLLILCFITSLKMLVHVWGKKYRYKSTWDLIENHDDQSDRNREIN